MLEKHGVWDQFRVDDGLEFNLICFVQAFWEILDAIKQGSYE